MEQIELNKVLNERMYGVEFEQITENGFLFKSSNYKTEFFNNLNQFKDSKKLCDVILGTETGKSLKAHKVVLASASSYFRAMFTGGFKEDTDCQFVSIDYINFECLETIIDFIYSSKILINETNAENLLSAAVMLQIEEVVNVCCIYFSKVMNVHNCIAIRDLALSHGCQELVKFSQNFVARNFCEFIKTVEFLKLNENSMSEILRLDHLNIRCETLTFNALIDWVKYDVEKRRDKFECLLPYIRYNFLSPHFLQEQLNNDKNVQLFQNKETSKCKKYLQDIIEKLISHKPPKICQSINIPFSLFGIYIVGGYQKKSIATVECFKFCPAYQWEKCTDMNVPRSGIACVSYALCVYAIGGRISHENLGSIDCADVECYDPFTNAWTRCSSLSVPRGRSAAATLDGYIYVVGGANNSEFLNSVERYNPRQDKWEFVTSMSIARIGHGCTVANRYLYTIGGFDGKNRLNNVEYFDPDTLLWQNATPMNVPRSGCGVCSFDSFVYAVGGYTANMQLNSVERYNILTDQWTFISSMKSSRSALACVAGKGKIMVFGGYNGLDFLDTVERYNIETDEWETISKMTSERSGHGAAISIQFKN